MNQALNKLLELGSIPLTSEVPILGAELRTLAGPLYSELVNMLQKKNGFYAFEAALHIYPTQSNGNEIGLNEWNDSKLWSSEYDKMTSGCLFFAENIFGDQFCIKEGEVYSFEAETGQLEFVARNLNDWAQCILADYEVRTGHPLAHEWQKEHGPIPTGMRLVPKTPFVLGGHFSVDNLYLLESSKAMRFRASIAKQIANLPDGEKIKLTTQTH